MDENIKLLKEQIKSIVNELIESSEKKDDGEKKKDDKYQNQYKIVQDMLNKPSVNATQVMSKSLHFKPNDDSKRSYAFKKLHKEKSDNGDTYEFTSDEIAKIYNEISS